MISLEGDDMPLYPYQERVKALIQSGKSVILQAPTGAGKTRAALAPFIENFFDKPMDAFPRKCVYVVPMRVLAHQFVSEYKGLAESYERRHQHTLNVQIQTGDQQDDKRLEGDLVFCTVDQFLSSYLTMPYSLPGRMANLNAGAMVGAYIVMDEFHLLDPDSTLPSVLFALGQLRHLAPVLLMTATFSADMLGSLAEQIDAEVVLVSQAEALHIETHENRIQPRRRTWRVSDQVLDAKAILDAHHTRSLALCNTVGRAQELYRELGMLIKERRLDTQLLLLHSRFLPADRRATEEELKRLFGKGAQPGGSFIAVATQTIEVGVDITSEMLHTELAPSSALIQRAGRCARYPGQQGQVIVYPVENFMPYGRGKDDPNTEDFWVKEMRAALGWLREHAGETFDFAKEQAFVNVVASGRDKQVLSSLAAGRRDRIEAIHRVLTGNQQYGQDQRLLVRNADSRRILIHADPHQLDRDPYAASGFNLDLHTLYGMFKSWQEREADAPWRVQMLIQDKADANESNRAEYGWQEINDRQLLAGAPVLVVHPALAGYLKDEGFVADRGDTGFISELPRETGKRAWDGMSYRLESYEDHIRYVLQAFQEIVVPELRHPAHALERAANWPEGSLLHAAWLVCLLHDVGKLSEGWQGWAHAYQKQISRPIDAGFAAAHTDYEWDNAGHREAEKAIRRRHSKPHHAGEGALAISAMTVKALGNEPLTRAALTAIARHHTPFAKDSKEFVLEAQAAQHIQATLAFVPQELRARVDVRGLKTEAQSLNSFSTVLAKPERDSEWLAYILLARALRRADQRGTELGSKRTPNEFGAYAD
jgi:CRISPR-associated endonuclease/helicase Cas3